MFDSLSDLLTRRAPHLKSASHASLLTLKKQWGVVCKEVGIPEKVEPVSLKNKKLTLSCSSRPQMAHVHRLKKQIQREVNNILEDTKVEDIKCVVRSDANTPSQKTNAI